MSGFSDLLSTPLSNIKRRPVLPIGTYHGIISGYVFGRSKNPEKQTAYVLFTYGLNSPGEDVDEKTFNKLDENGTPVYDLSKYKPTETFYLTPEASPRLKGRLEELGMDVDAPGATFMNLLPETKNLQVLVEIGIDPSLRNPNEFFNAVRGVKAA